MSNGIIIVSFWSLAGRNDGNLDANYIRNNYSSAKIIAYLNDKKRIVE